MDGTQQMIQEVCPCRNYSADCGAMNEKSLIGRPTECYIKNSDNLSMGASFVALIEAVRLDAALVEVIRTIFVFTTGSTSCQKARNCTYDANLK